MGRVVVEAAPITNLCPCGCGVTIFPRAELGYASAECLQRLHGTPPAVSKSSPASFPFIKGDGGKEAYTNDTPRPGTGSGTITPGQIPGPPPPIVFPSQYAKAADDEERQRRYDIFMEYATVDEIMAFQRGMIEAGLMDEPSDEQDERLEDVDMEAIYKTPVNVRVRPAVSQAQVLWARDMLAQFPKKSREQISRENGGITWAQLEHYAKTPLAGLPERSTKKANAEARTPAKREKRSHRSSGERS
jgi:hypothetical protein